MHENMRERKTETERQTQRDTDKQRERHRDTFSGTNSRQMQVITRAYLINRPTEFLSGSLRLNL